jgi:hypothetical protein
MNGTRAIGGRMFALAALVSSLGVAAVAAPVAAGHSTTGCAGDAALATRAAPPWVNLDAYLAAIERVQSDFAPVASVGTPPWVNLDAYLAALERVQSDFAPVASVGTPP